MARSLSKYQVLDVVRKYLEDRGQRVEELDNYTLVCYLKNEIIAVRVVLPTSPGRVLETMWEASSECRAFSFDRVYIAVPSNFLRRVVGKQMLMLRDMLGGYYKVGLLRVTDEGRVEEILAAPLRRGESPELISRGDLREHRESLHHPQSASPLTLQGDQAMRVNNREENIRGVIIETPMSSNTSSAASDLPEFVRDNPWFTVLSRRKASSG